jgi:hypothetical protein
VQHDRVVRHKTKRGSNRSSSPDRTRYLGRLHDRPNYTRSPRTTWHLPRPNTLRARRRASTHATTPPTSHHHIRSPAYHPPAVPPARRADRSPCRPLAVPTARRADRSPCRPLAVPTAPCHAQPRTAPPSPCSAPPARASGDRKLRHACCGVDVVVRFSGVGGRWSGCQSRRGLPCRA